jgi:undecaprenyl phosphate N,N'-diacetylbacillosamine 1-phosphate transferase
MGSPIIFTQERIGKNENKFYMKKFRSMTNKKDNFGDLLPEKDRLTKFGTLLRSTSLDELPELFNILKGDMSFVGPRPLPTYYMPYFYDNERVRHKVKGGLIPPDSLSLKSYTSWEEQFEYEIDYVSNISFALDIKIIISTFIILFKRVNEDYGSEFRPHLNKYRQDINKVEV